MKKIIMYGIVCLFMFSSRLSAAPSNSVSTPNSFTALSTIKSVEVNSNFNHVQNIYNAHTHTDVTQLGTVTSGVWDGTVISVQVGGTGKNYINAVQGSIPYFNTTGATTTILPGTEGQVLITHGSGSNPSWGSLNLLLTSGSLGSLNALGASGSQGTQTYLRGDKSFVQIPSSILAYGSSIASGTPVTLANYKIAFGVTPAIVSGGTATVDGLLFTNVSSYTITASRQSQDGTQRGIGTLNQVSGSRFVLTNNGGDTMSFNWQAVGT